jgi:uncharacterized protein YaaW (UPF0174 family)
MSNKPTYKKILEHPDRDEVISKLIIGISPSDITDWLKAKYTSVSDSKFIISENILKSFQKNYLDFYQDIQQDIAKTKLAVSDGTVDQLELAVKSNPTYEDAMLKLASGELNVELMMGKMALAIETRISQIYDIIQEDPRNINTKTERLWSEYIEKASNLLDKYYKWHENNATTVVQHNVTLQVVDQHISVFHDVIKEVLSQMDLETSLYFLEVFNDKMAKLKMPDPNAVPTTEMKLAEATLLNETINKKINEK